MDNEQRFTIDLEPIGSRTEITGDQTLLDAAQQAGVGIVAVCGGVGACGKCRVQCIEGQLDAITETERKFFTEEQLTLGFRLACKAHPLSDVKINIPPESLSTPQRLQVEGRESKVALDPIIHAVDVELDPPVIHDLRSDSLRLSEALVTQGIDCPDYSQPVLRHLSTTLRDQEWQARLAIRKPDANGTIHGRPEVVGVLHEHSQLVGFAVDIGTTKMAGYLVDLTTGSTLAKTGMMNPQIAYGEDVVSRIAYCNEHPDGREVLQARLIDSLNTMLGTLCEQAGTCCEQVVDMVVVGNTAIHHLFAGLPVTQLGAAPYIAAVSDALNIRAAHLGLNLAPGAKIYLPPNIAGYVGADHVSMLLATDAWRTQVPTVALDIGTNTEISLAVDGKLLSCSCASGPAFEGAHIHGGMRAAPGAVEYVQIDDLGVHIQTIDNKPAVGICGSGILDIVAELRSSGVVGPTGRMKRRHERVIPWEGGGAFVLVPEVETGNGKDLLVTRKDVNEIQLAKGAIRAGVETLLYDAGITYNDLGAFVVAGAFGTYLEIDSAVEIGMFPPIAMDKFHQVGNAAGTGARQMLISAERRRIAEQINEHVHYVELTAHPKFTDIYMDAMVMGKEQ